MDKDVPLIAAELRNVINQFVTDLIKRQVGRIEPDVLPPVVVR